MVFFLHTSGFVAPHFIHSIVECCALIIHHNYYIIMGQGSAFNSSSSGVISLDRPVPIVASVFKKGVRLLSISHPVNIQDHQVWMIKDVCVNALSEFTPIVHARWFSHPPYIPFPLCHPNIAPQYMWVNG